MAKIIFAFAMVFAAVIVMASGQGGYRDHLGNFYDLTTGQISSSLTGRVYSPAATHYGALPLAHYGAAVLPHHYGYGAPLVHHHAAVAPLLFK